MPKEILKIDMFHGGLSSNSDPRDIAPNELSAATDIMVDEVGKIRTMGGITAHGEVPAVVTKINPGYGLFQFSTDHKYNTIVITASADISGQVAADDYISDTAAPSDNIVFVTAVSTVTITGKLVATGLAAGTIPFESGNTIYDKGATYGGNPVSTSKTCNGTATITSDEDGEDWLANSDTESNATIDLYDKTTDRWALSIIDLGSTTGMKPCFYTVDGALRISDGNFNNTNQWYGYIDRVHFNIGGSYADTYNGWFSKDQEIASPTKGIVGTYDDILTGVSTGTNTTTLLDTGNFSNVTGSTTAATIVDHLALNLVENAAVAISSKVDDNNLTTASVTGWETEDVYMILPPAGTGFNIFMEYGTGDSEWDNATYDLAQGTGFDTISIQASADSDHCLNGYLHLFNPSSTTFIKHYIARMCSNNEGDMTQDEFSGGYLNTTSAVDAIQFKMDSGEIQAGSIFLHGLSTS